jgi:hypothetical protein
MGAASGEFPREPESILSLSTFRLASYGQMHRVSLKGLDEQAATGADGNPLWG